MPEDAAGTEDGSLTQRTHCHSRSEQVPKPISARLTDHEKPGALRRIDGNLYSSEITLDIILLREGGAQDPEHHDPETEGRRSTEDRTRCDEDNDDAVDIVNRDGPRRTLTQEEVRIQASRGCPRVRRQLRS